MPILHIDIQKHSQTHICQAFPTQTSGLKSSKPTIPSQTSSSLHQHTATMFSCMCFDPLDDIILFIVSTISKLILISFWISVFIVTARSGVVILHNLVKIAGQMAENLDLYGKKRARSTRLGAL